MPAAAIHSACHAWMNHFALAIDLRTECKAPEKEFKATQSQRKRPARYEHEDPLSSWIVSHDCGQVDLL